MGVEQTVAGPGERFGEFGHAEHSCGGRQGKAHAVAGIDVGGAGADDAAAEQASGGVAVIAAAEAAGHRSDQSIGLPGGTEREPVDSQPFAPARPVPVLGGVTDE